MYNSSSFLQYQQFGRIPRASPGQILKWQHNGTTSRVTRIYDIYLYIIAACIHRGPQATAEMVTNQNCSCSATSGWHKKEEQSQASSRPAPGGSRAV